MLCKKRRLLWIQLCVLYFLPNLTWASGNNIAGGFLWLAMGMMTLYAIGLLLEISFIFLVLKIWIGTPSKRVLRWCRILAFLHLAPIGMLGIPAIRDLYLELGCTGFQLILFSIWMLFLTLLGWMTSRHAELKKIDHVENVHHTEA